MLKGFCITLALLAFAVVASGADCTAGQCAAPRTNSPAPAAQPSTTRGHHHRKQKRHHHERRGLLSRRHCCR